MIQLIQNKHLKHMKLDKMCIIFKFQLMWTCECVRVHRKQVQNQKSDHLHHILIHFKISGNFQTSLTFMPLAQSQHILPMEAIQRQTDFICCFRIEWMHGKFYHRACFQSKWKGGFEGEGCYYSPLEECPLRTEYRHITGRLQE